MLKEDSKEDKKTSKTEKSEKLWSDGTKSWQPSELVSFHPKNRLRFLTATALYDGHDASINIMRRLLQSRGAELIHLGHNRSAQEIAKAALEEDVHAIAISSYQGGHVEFFKYLRKLLDEQGGKSILLFGGGGGVIVPEEIEELKRSGIKHIYSPQDGQNISLQGIIGHMLASADFKLGTFEAKAVISPKLKLSRTLTLLEQGDIELRDAQKALEGLFNKRDQPALTLGITGTGGAGKSSLTDELLLRFLDDHPKIRIAVLCVDPSKSKTGGGLLGDRIRMNVLESEQIFLRSFATRGSGHELTPAVVGALSLLKNLDFDLVVLETSGIGQGDARVRQYSDLSIYVMTPEFGAATQLEKIDMLDYADLIAINKFERRGGPDAFLAVKEVFRRNRYEGQHKESKEYPIFGTIASRFSDDGVQALYVELCQKINSRLNQILYKPDAVRLANQCSSKRDSLIPGHRSFYLSQIAEAVRSYHKMADEKIAAMKEFEAISLTQHLLQKESTTHELRELADKHRRKVGEDTLSLVDTFLHLRADYLAGEFSYQVRNKDIRIDTKFETLSGLKIPRVALPSSENKSALLEYILKENIPGSFPYTAGVFPFRRRGEDPVRMFAGEGGPSRTNKRFKFLSAESDAKRLSTAFDSVTLYGADPAERPDIYGKVGTSGVSIATLADMKDLYDGFNLCDPKTSVSMTINGPAPILLAMFLNTAIDQQMDSYLKKEGGPPSPEQQQAIVDQTLNIVRGTVQADILKEDQAQNTCIFSTEFSLRLMGDIQEYFIKKNVRNYYSVSISGYHIAEAGANPITQLALTLANGFTYVEYYLARGMKIDDFAPNLSFFFSNGIDAEYAVLGRVARRIWAIAMRDVYGANSLSQRLKYHIQTSGRSLHAQEIDFNDIRTTLQALLALYDNCNSLHTNAYDEAITTPSEGSVRRALAIQMIINQEFGPNKSENINQGSYFLSQLTDLVEEAVLKEFDRLSERGGVLGAMETQYQRNLIQEESLKYERQKDSGELPIIGVNTFLSPHPVAMGGEVELMRASYDEKNEQIERLKSFQTKNLDKKDQSLKELARVALSGGNIFAELMTTVRHASLGEICQTLYNIGGRYRRSM